MRTIAELIETIPKRIVNWPTEDRPPVPSPAEQGCPECFLVQRSTKAHYYGKQCCLPWQPQTVDGMRGYYRWESVHDGFTSLLPYYTPTWHDTTAHPGCLVADNYPNNLRAVGGFTGVNNAISLGGEGGLWAINTAEFSYGTDIQRLTVDNHTPPGVWVIICMGLHRDRLLDPCPDEPRPDRPLFFFHSYKLVPAQPC